MVMVLVEVAADTQVLAAVHGRSVWQRDNGVVVGRAGFYLYAQVALYARDRGRYSCDSRALLKKLLSPAPHDIPAYPNLLTQE